MVEGSVFASSFFISALLSVVASVQCLSAGLILLVCVCVCACVCVCVCVRAYVRARVCVNIGEILCFLNVKYVT